MQDKNVRFKIVSGSGCVLAVMAWAELIKDLERGIVYPGDRIEVITVDEVAEQKLEAYERPSYSTCGRTCASVQ